MNDSSDTSAPVGRFVFGLNGRVVPDLSDGPIAYYKPHWFTITWIACRTFKSEGCAAIDNLHLSLESPPPSLRNAPPPAPAPAKVRPTKIDQDMVMIEDLIKLADGIHHWWTKPMPPLSSLLPKPAEPRQPVPGKSAAQRTVPPFDIQQIPKTMERLRLPVSARMMRHWFTGRANYSLTQDDVTRGIDQNGKPYAPDMIDQSIVKLDWVLNFARAKEAYEKLLSELIRSPKAMEEIKKKILMHMVDRASHFLEFDCMSASNDNIHELHRDFQFQLVRVDSTGLDKALQWVGGKIGLVRALDDLTGALGSFSIYAALGEVSFDLIKRIARVKSVHVYVRDSYSFNDEKEHLSQYLGHWNERSIYLVPTPVVIDSQAARRVGFAAPLIDVAHSIYDKGAVMYPVSNKSFRDWRAKHMQGGDFIAYTESRRIRLARDLQVTF